MGLPPQGFSTMSSALPGAANYHQWVLSRILPGLGPLVLEIGFGYGQYTGPLAERAERVVAVDSSPACLENPPTLPANVELRLADLAAEDFTKITGTGLYDAVVCLNVLEHVEDDGRALKNMAAALRPGGRMLLLVPALDSLYGPLDRLAGHHRRYGRKRLAGLLARAGFEVRALDFFNPLGGLGWWLNSRLARPSHLSAPLVNHQIIWFDRCLVPLSRRLDPLTRSFFGQSLWAEALLP